MPSDIFARSDSFDQPFLITKGRDRRIVQFSARGNADRHIVGDDARKQLVHKRNITFDLLRDRATAGPLILVETS